MIAQNDLSFHKKKYTSNSLIRKNDSDFEERIAVVKWQKNKTSALERRNIIKAHVEFHHTKYSSFI